MSTNTQWLAWARKLGRHPERAGSLFLLGLTLTVIVAALATALILLPPAVQ